jgi:hypothetical protein
VTRGRLARTAVGGALALVVVGGAGTAWAEGFVTVPPEPVTTHRVVTLTGDVDATERDRLELRLAAPATAPQVVATLDPAATTDRARSLSAELDTGACGQGAVCGSGTAPNGSWEVQLVAVRPPELGGEERVLATAALVLDVAARTPAGVRAEVTAPRQVTVSWVRGTEPDLLRWQVSDGAGVSKDVEPDGACDGDRCSATFGYGGAEGGTRTFAVAATRACAGDGCAPVLSAPASSGAVDITAVGSSAAPGSPGAPPPAAAPGTSTGTGTADTRSLGLGLGSFGPTLPAPVLPALPQPPSVAAPEVAPDGFEGTLGYEDRVEVEALPDDAVEPSGRRAAVATTTGTLLGNEELARGLAGGLVLLLGGAHLRTWLARAPRDELPGGPA